MVLKRLAELTTHELMSEFEKAGFEEEFSESLALVKLTIYLVSSGVDPFTFLYNLLVGEATEERSMNVCEFESDTSEDFPSEKPDILVLGIADEVSAGSFIPENFHSTQSAFVIVLEASSPSNDESSRKTLHKSLTQVLGNHLHSAHCWALCFLCECSYRISGNCSSFTCSLISHGSCSCSVCENCAVEMKKERPDGWPPDIPALYHTNWECRETLLLDTYQDKTNNEI